MNILPLDPLRLPLQGIQVIEASAGTGKTYTVAALYVRLVLGHGCSALTPPQILVMTFTEAATAELRDRIRQRLMAAAKAFRQPQIPADADAFLQALMASYADTEWPQCAWRLEAAAQWMDEAAIFTIHGWSSRMLREHAFDSSSLFAQSTVEDGASMKLRATTDYWRQWYYPLSLDQWSALDKVGHTPEALMKNLAPYWREQERQPLTDPAPALPDPLEVIGLWCEAQARVLALQEVARAMWLANGPALAAQLSQAMDRDLNGNSYRAADRAGYLNQLLAWSEGANLSEKVRSKFSLHTLKSKVKKNQTIPVDHHGAYAAMQAWDDAACNLHSPHEALLAHAAQHIAQNYDRHKAQLAQFDFADLLTRLHAALHQPNSRLAETIRSQYPVALVDEFQDTDAWQWGALSRIYPEAQATDTGLLLIGDPKQAIYSFRGADLGTYLEARQQAQAVHTLSHNYRSTPQVIRAVNHVFLKAQEPFGAVTFTAAVPPVTPNAQPLQRSSTPCIQPAMTVWHAQAAKPWSQEDYVRSMAAVCASEMVRLLSSGDVQPADLAVLVRDGREARSIRQALQQRGVRSVYLSERDSVYATPEALDLWHVLRAVAQPQSVRRLKAALTCRTLGMSASEIEQCVQDEAAWDLQVERFGRWHQVWLHQGLWPMLSQCLHEQQIPQRLMAQGADAERRLTNLLHLGDLLQKASMNLQGQGALLRYLADQLHNPQASGDTAQMRLETDAELVQVITMHKSKGLQFPVVFLPFVANFRTEKKESRRSDVDRLEEDKRLLYVALTRAKQALYLGVAARAKDIVAGPPFTRSSALSELLGRQSLTDLPERLKVWAECDDIQVLSVPEASDACYLPAASAKGVQSALTPTRSHANSWWMASFSALTRKSEYRVQQASLPSESDDRWQDAQTDSLPTELRTELLTSDVPAQNLRFNAFKAGSAYGTLLHDLLEWQLKEGWPLSTASSADIDAAHRWTQLWDTQTASLQLDRPQCDLLASWLVQIADTPLHLGAVLNDPLTPDLRLSQMNSRTSWPEMNFTLCTHGVKAQSLDAIITRHVLPGMAREPLQARSLQGLLTGFMDVVLEHQGRYYVLDYKSNKLEGYTPTDLSQGMLAHRYDVQASLYLLALHRLLQARLPGYDYNTHMGGAVYLFARGIDQTGAGVWAARPPQDMVIALDAAFKEQV
jgi:exodeoxyribonuclease V beta subunit